VDETRTPAGREGDPPSTTDEVTDSELVSVVLPTVRPGPVSAAIEAIRAQTDPHWELIVVYQGDDPDLAMVIEQFAEVDPRIRAVHSSPANLSHARNVGIAAARGSILAFTDDDCEVSRDWVEVIRREMGKHPRVGIVGGEVVAEPNRKWWSISTCPAAHVIECVYIPGEQDEPDHGFYMIGANFCARRTVADRVGPFDEVLGAGARFGNCEDQDFMFRAESLGYGLMTTKRLLVTHSSGRRYGIKSFVRHQRNYARGRGAWVAKLVLWGHPLGAVWSQPPTARQHLASLIRRPHRWLFERWAQRIADRAAAEYREAYQLDVRAISVPRTSGSEENSGR
jgi:glycosyltransferase involved in cell wall biosynthesis